MAVSLAGPGLAIGGLSVGEELDFFGEILGFVMEDLRSQKPYYVMGIGTPR